MQPDSCRISICNSVGLWLALGVLVACQADEGPAVSPDTSPEIVSDSIAESNASGAGKDSASPDNVVSSLEKLHKPISAITLGNAVAPTSLAGDILSTPTSVSEQQAPESASHQMNGTRRFHRPARNMYPICYNPLYFEDPNLERCGQTHGWATEFVSAARFFGRVPLVPYMMGVTPPCDCVRALPDCPVCHRFGHDAYVPSPNLHAVGLESAAVVGLIFLIP